MKPFVLLATRAEDLPADAEYALFLRYAGLDERDLIRVRVEAEPMPALDLDAISGIFVGGGPFNASDPPDQKSAVQHRVEAGDVRIPRHAPWLDDLKAEVLAFPNGRHDDQVDALSQLLNWISTRWIDSISIGIPVQVGAGPSFGGPY